MRRWLVILALPFLLWSAYWGAGAYTFKQGMERVLQGKQHGMLFSRYTDAQIGGFPRAFQMNVSGLELHQAGGVFSWGIPQVDLRASSYQPQNVRMEIAGEQRIETALGALSLGADIFEVGVLMRPTLDLPLGRAQLQLEGARLAHEIEGWHLEFEQLLMELRDIPNRYHEIPVPYQLTLAATELELSDLAWDLPSSHQVIESLRADLGLGFSSAWDRSVLNQGPPQLEALLVHGIALHFGDSEVVVAGQLNRSAAGLLSGELVIDILNWREILNILRQSGYMDPDIAGLIEDLIAGQQDTGEERVQVPLTLNEGVVSIGVFTLGLLPPLP